MIADLSARHFVLQEGRPAGYDDVDVVTLEPVLRGLLFSDGGVARALAAHTLGRVSVEVMEQEPAAAEARPAEWLEAPAGTPSIRRRVVTHLAGHAFGSAPAAHAESHILPERLPAQFSSVLARNPEGIGEALREIRLESRRELLWFGLAAAPAWAADLAGHESLVRSYLVVSGGLPAILIFEGLAVEWRAGRWRLAEPRPSFLASANGSPVHGLSPR